MASDKKSDQSVADLRKALIAKRKEQLLLRIQHNNGELSQTHLLRQVRRQVAKIKTELGANQKLATTATEKNKPKNEPESK